MEYFCPTRARADSRSRADAARALLLRPLGDGPRHSVSVPRGASRPSSLPVVWLLLRGLEAVGGKAMKAFVDTTWTKSAIMKQLRKHAKADKIEKGYYWEDGKGCAIGCTIHSGDHAEYEPRFGIP